MGATDQASHLLDQIEKRTDLDRLASNPFLLTLVCGLTHTPRGGDSPAIPLKRGELYAAAIEAICQQATTDAGAKRFTPGRLDAVAQFALWLMRDAPEAPRYTFESEHVCAGSGRGDLFDQCLKPSRMVAQVYDDSEEFQFLHTTFQEFLAARALVAELDRRSLSEAHMANLGRSPAWVETMRFAAGLAQHEPSLRKSYWQAIRQLVQAPDRFGQVHRRVAYLLSEEQPADGGKELLGIDLREPLWQETLDFANAYRPAMDATVDAFAELDAGDYIARVEYRIAHSESAERANLERSLRRLPNSKRREGVVLAQLFGADENLAPNGFSGPDG